MQNLIVFVVAIFALVSVALSENVDFLKILLEENKLNVEEKANNLNLKALFEARQKLAHQNRFLKEIAPKTQQDDLNLLCQPCLQFFGTLKDVVGDVSTLTKDTLEEALNTTCKYLEGSVPFVDKVCEVFGPKIIDMLYTYLTEIAKEIQPVHDCKLLLLCWDKEEAKNFGGYVKELN